MILMEHANYHVALMSIAFEHILGFCQEASIDITRNRFMMNKLIGYEEKGSISKRYLSKTQRQ